MLLTQVPRGAGASIMPDAFSPFGKQPHMSMSPLDLSNATPRRIPKLAVRNKTVDIVHSSEESNSERSDYFSTARPRSDDQGAEMSLSRGMHQRTDSRQSQSPAPKEIGKRKSGRVLGFLTLKEPSTSALEEFADQERKKLANARTKVLSGVSSQKLPDHVPKVNSRWDGLPELARKKAEKDKARLSHETANRNSTTSVNSQHSGRSDRARLHSSRRSYGSLSSMPTARRSQEKTRNVSISITHAVDHHPDGQPRQMHSPPPVQLHPAFRVRPECSPAPPELDMPGSPARADQDSSGPEEGSPKTPALDSVPTFRSMAHSSVTEQELDATNEFRGFVLNDDEDSIVRTSDHDDIDPAVEVKFEKSDSCEPFPFEAITQTILEEYLPRDQIPAKRSSNARPDSYIRNFSHVAKFCPADVASAKGGYTPNIALTTEETPDCYATISNGEALSSIEETKSYARSTPNSLRAGEGRIVAPVVIPPKAKNKEVLPWEMFEPPAENQPSVSAYSAKDNGRKQKRFSSRLGRK